MTEKPEAAGAAIQSPGGALAESLRRSGGWRGYLSKLAIFMISGFALFMPPVALYELARVEQVRSWQPTRLVLLDVVKRTNNHRRGAERWVWSFREPTSGRLIETSDYAPGDLPSSGPGWSTMESTAKAWQQHAGRRVTVWMSPDGKTVYPSQGGTGTMTVVLTFCAAWWLLVAINLLRRRASR